MHRSVVDGHPSVSVVPLSASPGESRQGQAVRPEFWVPESHCLKKTWARGSGVERRTGNTPAWGGPTGPRAGMLSPHR